jgi:hypothetical protein
MGFGGNPQVRVFSNTYNFRLKSVPFDLKTIGCTNKKLVDSESPLLSPMPERSFKGWSSFEKLYRSIGKLLKVFDKLLR